MSVFQNGLDSILVSWTVSGESIGTGYIISYQQLDGVHSDSVTVDDTAVTSTIITGLVIGATYSISIVATSNTLPSTETTVPDDITIGNMITVEYSVWRLRVLLSPSEPAIISLTTSPSSIMAGDIVTLTCTVTLPSGVTDTPDFQWEGPGGVTPTPEDSLTNGQTVSSDLILTAITTSQAGQYNCTATLSGSITESINITVQSK